MPITSPLSVMPTAFPVPTGGPSSSCLIIPRVRHACQMILERMDSLLYSWGTQHTQVLTEALLSKVLSNQSYGFSSSHVWV